MKIKNSAKAGTLESNDCLIEISPDDDISIEVDSEVYDQFKDQIDSTIHQTLDEHDIDGAKIRMEDRGALDCTIKARLTTAIRRSNEED